MDVSETVQAPVLNQIDHDVIPVERKRSFVGMHKDIEKIAPLIIPGYVTYGY